MAPIMFQRWATQVRRRVALTALVEKDPQNASAVPAAEYKGNPLEAVWLPNEAVAKKPYKPDNIISQGRSKEP